MDDVLAGPAVGDGPSPQLGTHEHGDDGDDGRGDERRQEAQSEREHEHDGSGSSGLLEPSVLHQYAAVLDQLAQEQR